MARNDEKPTMLAREMKLGSEWYVRITWSDGRSKDVSGFASEKEAEAWIATEFDGRISADG